MSHASYLSWFDAVKTPEPEPWDIESGTGPVANAAYYGEVFRSLEDRLVQRDPTLAERLRRLKVVVTPNAGELPITGPDVVAFLFTDEWARVPRWNDQVALTIAPTRDRRFRDAVRMLPRPLGAVETLDEVRVRVERELWARRGHRPDRGHRTVVAVPLGYAHQGESPAVPWEDRDIDVFFAGSLVHGSHRGGPVRRALRRTVGNIKVMHRERMVAAAEDLRAACPGLTVRVDVVDGDRVSDDTDSYGERMARSRFCLDPRGTSRETYRFYEAARVGSVPVVTSLPSGGIFDGAPAVRLRHWSQLTAAMQRLSRQPDEARALHEGVQEWYQRHGSPAATATRLVPLVEKVLRDLP